MIILEQQKQLVLHTGRYNEVAEAIPHATVFKHKGRILTALRHGVEETLVLRNLGFKQAPPPILSYYNWPARFPPMEHQKTTAGFLTANRRALVLSAPGTGKSLSALWAADYLLTEKLARKVLIVCPLSIVKTVWGKELTHHLPHRSFEILVGHKSARLQRLRTPGTQFFIINHDGFKVLEPYLEDMDVVIYDEATALKTPGTSRFRRFFKWVNAHNRWLWLMTGTPIAQSPVDAWALARLVNSTTVPASYTAFRDLVMQRISVFKWAPRANAAAICQQVLQPSIRFSLDECVELPEMVVLDHECEMTTEQIRAFREMREKAVLMAHDISAPNMAVVLQKLIQICCGVVYGMDGVRVALDASGRYDVLREVMSEIGGKCIVFVPLRGVQDALEARLKADGADVASVHGEVVGKKRESIFDAFQNTAQYSVLLAHPKVAAHGLTLTRAKDVIWYAPVYSLEMYEQANARVRRIGTEGKTRVHHLYGTSFERELYRRLQAKQRVLSEFLTLVSGVND